jgi:hypothetical protein
MGTRQQGGFDGLEGWAIKEISQGMLLRACLILPFDARTRLYFYQNWKSQLMTSYHLLSLPTPGALPSESLPQPQMQNLIHLACTRCARLCSAAI